MIQISVFIQYFPSNTFSLSYSVITLNTIFFAKIKYIFNRPIFKGVGGQFIGFNPAIVMLDTVIYRSPYG